MGDGIFVEGTGSGSQNLNVQGPITLANNIGDDGPARLGRREHDRQRRDRQQRDHDIAARRPAAGPTCASNILGGGITISHGGNSNTDATLTNNNIQNSCIGAIAVGTTGSVVDQQSAQVDATIQNNIIGTAGVAGSGSVQGNGIFVDSNGNGLVRTLITGNSIRQWTNRNGIALDVLDGDAEMSATVRGNLLTEPNSAFIGTTTRGMTIQLGAAQAGDSIDACLDIGHATDNAQKNTLTDTGEIPQPDVRYLHEGPSSAVQLAGFAGGANQTDITNWFTSRNISAPPRPSAAPSALLAPPPAASPPAHSRPPDPEDQYMSEPFLGELKLMSFNFAPKTWAQCNGQLLPINQNQALFSLLGTMYGGNGQTTFGLPDMRGRVPIHRGDYAQGERIGEETHTLNSNEMPAHPHGAQASTQNGTQADPKILAAASNAYTGPSNLTTISPGTVSNTGGGQAHENRQPYLVLNWCIALQGIFPSRN